MLATPSVGATENAMLAACGAEGETVICNAAREPEIADLQDFLCAMGAEVRGAGGSVITVSPKRPLHGCVHRVIPDRIVAATYLWRGRRRRRRGHAAERGAPAPGCGDHGIGPGGLRRPLRRGVHTVGADRAAAGRTAGADGAVSGVSHRLPRPY